jgi:hypothetical protein
VGLLDVGTRRRSRRLTPVVLVVVVGSLVGGAWWWFRAGPRLEASIGARTVGIPAAVGVPVNAGVQLHPTHGVVTLVSARAIGLSDAVRAMFSAAIDEDGNELQEPLVGDLAHNGYRAAPVRNTRVDHDRYIAMTLYATRPGVYDVHEVEIRYRSGARTRTETAEVDVCYFAYPPALADVIDGQLAMPAPPNPLVRAYQHCAPQL